MSILFHDIYIYIHDYISIYIYILPCYESMFAFYTIYTCIYIYTKLNAWQQIYEIKQTVSASDNKSVEDIETKIRQADTQCCPSLFCAL